MQSLCHYQRIRGFPQREGGAERKAEFLSSGAWVVTAVVRPCVEDIVMSASAEGLVISFVLLSSLYTGLQGFARPRFR